jgi:DNA repair exonuclease SbcCD ATPase subunit
MPFPTDFPISRSSSGDEEDERRREEEGDPDPLRNMPVRSPVVQEGMSSALAVDDLAIPQARPGAERRIGSDPTTHYQQDLERMKRPQPDKPERNERKQKIGQLLALAGTSTALAAGGPDASTANAIAEGLSRAGVDTMQDVSEQYRQQMKGFREQARRIGAHNRQLEREQAAAGYERAQAEREAKRAAAADKREQQQRRAFARFQEQLERATSEQEADRAFEQLKRKREYKRSRPTVGEQTAQARERRLREQQGEDATQAEELKQKITQLDRKIRAYAGIEGQLSDEQQTALQLARERKRVLQENLQRLTSEESALGGGSDADFPRPSDPPPGLSEERREEAKAAGELLQEGQITQEEHDAIVYGDQ